MACMAATVSLGMTLATGSMAGGVIAATLLVSSQASAATVTGTGTSQDPFVISSSSGAVSLVSYTPSGGTPYSYTENDYLKLQITGGNLTNTDEVIVANVQIGELTLTDAYPGRTYTFQGSITGSGNFSYNKTSLSGYQKWVFTGDVSQYTGAITINGAASKDNSLTISGGTDVAASSIQLTNADLILGKSGYASNVSSSTVSARTLTVVEGATVSFTGAVDATTLNAQSGSNLTLSGVSTIETVNVQGGVAIKAGATANITTLNALAGSTLTLAGTSTIGSLSMANTSKATVAGDTTVSTAVLRGSLEIAAGETLSLDGTLTLGGLTLSGAGTVDLTDLRSLTADTQGLSAISTDEVDGDRVSRYEVLKVQDTVQLVGLDEFTTSSSNFSWDSASGTLYYLQLQRLQGWDANWGEEVLEKAPDYATLPVASGISSGAGLATAPAAGSTNPYAGSGYYAAKLTSSSGASAGSIVAGGYYNPTTGSNDSGNAALATNTWMYVDSGSWGILVGGNYCNNWSGGTALNFTGDTHILMQGGTANAIVGGNHLDGKSPSFTGNTYISVFGPSSVGFVVGANTSGHSAATTFTGSTNIWIYTALTGTPSENFVNLGAANAAIVGGSSWASNSVGGSFTINGSTNINIDLVKYSSSGASFDRRVVGGSYIGGSSNNPTATHTGDTNVTITSADSTTFSKEIVGGSYMLGSAGKMVHNGGINLSINGGTYTSNILLSGSIAAGCSASVAGEAKLDITGGVFQGYILGGVSENTGASSLSSGAITMNLQGGTYGGAIVGGHAVRGNGDVDLTAFSTGDIHLTLGSKTEVNGPVFGGSAVLRNPAAGSTTTWNQGAITVTVESGAQINGNIYAAGGAYNLDNSSEATSSVALTTSSTRVEIEGGSQLKDGITISGGYLGMDNATVSGDSTLAAIGKGNANLTNVNIEKFTVADAASGATLTLNADQMTTAGITSKTGEGTLAISGGTMSSPFTVGAGTLAIDSDSPVTFGQLTMSSNTTLAFSTENSLVVDTLDCLAGAISFDVSSFGFLAAGTHLTLATVNTSFTGQEGVTVTGLDEDFTGVLALVGTSLTMEVQAKPGVYVWGGASGTWANGQPFGAVNYDNNDAEKVRFDPIAGTNSTVTVTMEGDLVVGDRLLVNPGATNTYEFESGKGGILTSVKRIEVASGTASFGSNTLALDGSEQTSVSVAAGAALEMADAGAGQMNLTLGDKETGGASFSWNGSDPEKSTIKGTVTAHKGSDVTITSGTLILAGADNTLDDVLLQGTSSLQLQGDTTLTGAIAAQTQEAGQTLNVLVNGADGIAVTMTGGSSLDKVSLIGSEGATLRTEGEVSMDASSQIRGMHLYIAKGATLTWGTAPVATGISTLAAPGLTPPQSGSYILSLSGEGALRGSKDFVIQLGKGTSYTYTGSLEEYAGTITVQGSGVQTINSQLGELSSVSFAAKGDATVVLGNKVTDIVSLSATDGGTAELMISKGDGTNAASNIGTLTVGDNSALGISLELTKSMEVVGREGTGAVQVSGFATFGSGSQVELDITGLGAGLNLVGGDEATLVVLESNVAEGKTEVTANASSSKLLSKYFGDTAELKQQGSSLLISGTTVTPETANFHKSEATSSNGYVGAVMLDGLYSTLNPQATDPESDAAAILDELEQMILSGNSGAADRKMAAVSGAGVTALGTAFAADMQRQLTAIRNRTTTMGIGDAYVNPDMPYFNAWVNAEANYREMSEDGTLPGYELNSWGATVGVDADVTPYLTCGLALTAMYSDFTAKMTDTTEGDLDVYYVTAFARYAPSAWVHTFVASVGMADASVDRTVSYTGGSYKASGDTNGVSFGLMYEVGYTISMDEEGSTALQPVANITYAHSSLDGYCETGSDMAVRYGDQTLDMLTIGLGLRAQTVVGENVYNRTSLLEGRVLAKFDLGDRSSSTQASLASLPAFGGTVESAESGAFGVEIGAGVTIPISQDSGSIFVDAALELRSDYTNVNGTVGYRINF